MKAEATNSEPVDGEDILKFEATTSSQMRIGSVKEAKSIIRELLGNKKETTIEVNAQDNEGDSTITITKLKKGAIKLIEEPKDAIGDQPYVLLTDENSSSFDSMTAITPAEKVILLQIVVDFVSKVKAQSELNQASFRTKAA